MEFRVSCRAASSNPGSTRWRPEIAAGHLPLSSYGSFGRRDGLDSPGGSAQLQDAVGRLGIRDVQLRPSSNCSPTQWRSLRVASTTANPKAGPLGVVKPGPLVQRGAAVAGPSPISLLVKPGPPTQPRPHAVAGQESLSLHLRSPPGTLTSSPQASAGPALPRARSDSGRSPPVRVNPRAWMGPAGRGMSSPPAGWGTDPQQPSSWQAKRCRRGPPGSSSPTAQGGAGASSGGGARARISQPAFPRSFPILRVEPGKLRTPNC